MTLSMRPDDILGELGIVAPRDIDIEAIAQHCGATVLYERLDGCEAQILGSKGRALIVVRQDAPRPRQRFSAAHELGHWMRDRGRTAALACTETSLLSEWSRLGPEQRANRFAAELLLPTPMFRGDVRDRDMTLETASGLAQRYQTSLTATSIRLVELGSFPALLVCTMGGRRRWFVRSPDLPESLFPHRSLEVGTLAHALLQGGAAISPSDVSVDLWIDHADADRYTVQEDSRAAGDAILTLLWWKDERQLIDLVG